VPVDLCEAVTGLDAANVARFAQAVLHAGGHRGGLVRVAGTEQP
jgi:hypothetical protein